LLATIGKIDGDRLMSVSVREWLDQSVTHAEVKELILAAFRVATYTNAPDLMSAGAAIEQLKKAQDKSVLYLDGGWQTLVDALHDTAAISGVNIETGVKVSAVTRDSTGVVTGVRLADGSEVRASNVIVASSPAVLAELVERFEQTSLAPRRVRTIPVRAACLDLALSRLPKPGATFALGIDRPHYFSVHSAAARLAPEGSAMIHAAKYLPPDHQASNAEVERELEDLLDIMQPGWREVLVYRRFLPDMMVMNALPLASMDGTRGRPSPELIDVPGLFVVGDWVGDEGLLVDASLASARRAAELIATSPVVTAAARAS
jgi:phytoene dehydrogenase-like protein